MKTAELAAVPDRGPLDRSHRPGVGASRVDRMSDLLRRYPAIDTSEREQLLAFLTRGDPEEIVQAVHLRGLDAQLAAVRKDHRRQFRSGLSGWLPTMLFLGIPVLGVIWRLLVWH